MHGRRARPLPEFEILGLVGPWSTTASRPWSRPWSRWQSRGSDTGFVGLVGGAAGFEDVATGCSPLVGDIPFGIAQLVAAQLVAIAGTMLAGGWKTGTRMERVECEAVDPSPGRSEGEVATAAPSPLSPPSTSLPSEPSTVWEAAWAPLGGKEGTLGKSDGGIDGREPVAWVGSARREAMWVGAIDPWRVEGLLRICLAEIERFVGEEGMRGMFVTRDGDETEIAMDGVLIGLAQRVAVRWLGYVPRVLETAAEGRLASAAPMDQMTRVDGGSQRGALYARVLRLLLGLGEEGAGAPSASSAANAANDTDAAIPMSWSSGRTVALGVEATSGKGQPGVHADRLYHIAPSVLHDMVFTVADSVCGAYMQDVVAGGFGRRRQDDKDAVSRLATREASLWPTFLDARLGSTRDVQRFINRMYLWRLMEEYILETVAIYEDRLPLTRLVGRGRGQPGLVIRQGTVRVRRYNELATLSGLKYFVSLLVECHDVLRPMLANCRRWLVDVVSWVLREIVGKGIGFVWEGIRNVRSEKKDGNDGVRWARRGQGGQGGRRQDDAGNGGDPDDYADAWPAAGVFV